MMGLDIENGFEYDLRELGVNEEHIHHVDITERRIVV